jgi:hypothetical protein
MQFDNFSNLIIGILILAIGGYCYLLFYVRSLASDLAKLAYQLDFEVTRRSDMLPLLLESLGQYLPREKYLEVLKARSASMLTRVGQNGKAEKEALLWEKVDSALSSLEEGAQKNLQLVAFRSSVQEVNEKISTLKNSYNQKVRTYKNWTRFPMVKLFQKSSELALSEEF